MMRIIRKVAAWLRGPVKVVPVMVPVLQADLLRGRRALVTGGASGIGLGVAEAFLNAGADVILAGRNERRLQAAKETLSRKSDCVSIATLDVCDVKSLRRRLDGVGEFDILVNNAGYVGGGNFGATSEDEYDKALDTNLRGAYFLSQEVSKRWIESGIKGNILNICSASSLRPGDSPYILSKWGLRALTVGMAKRLVKHGIVVNGLAPGCTNTVQFSGGGNLINTKNPSGRLVTVQEVANLAVVLVSTLSRMVVGDILYVTGGGAITTLDD